MAGKRRRAAVQFQLRVIVDETIHLYRLPEAGRVSIGRAAECDVRISDPTVSRHHAVIEIEDGVIRVRDAGSSYGLRVRQQRLDPQRSMALLPGDAIEAGGAVLVVERAVAAPPRPRPRGRSTSRTAKAGTRRR